MGEHDESLDPEAENDRWADEEKFIQRLIYREELEYLRQLRSHHALPHHLPE